MFNKNKVKAIGSILLMAVSIILMKESPRYGALGDYLLEAMGIASWTSDNTGGHLTVIYLLVVLMFSIIFTRIYVIDHYKVKWSSALFYVIVLISLMSHVVDSVITNIKSDADGLQSIEYIDEGNVFEYKWRDGVLEDFVMVFTLKNYSDEDHDFLVTIDSRWMRGDGLDPIQILNKDGTVASFSLFEHQEKTFVITPYKYTYSGGKTFDNGGGNSSIQEVILTSDDQEVKLSNNDFFGTLMTD